MISMGASYARLHVQQEHYKERLKIKEGEEAKGEKKGSKRKVHLSSNKKGKVHPGGPATSSSNPWMKPREEEEEEGSLPDLLLAICNFDICSVTTHFTYFDFFFFFFFPLVEFPFSESGGKLGDLGKK